MVPPFKPLCASCGVRKTAENCRLRTPGHFMPRCRECDGITPSHTERGKPRKSARGSIVRARIFGPDAEKLIGETFIKLHSVE